MQHTGILSLTTPSTKPTCNYINPVDVGTAAANQHDGTGLSCDCGFCTDRGCICL